MIQKNIQIGRDYIQNILTKTQSWLIEKRTQVELFFKDNGWKIATALFVGALLYQKDIQVHIGKDNVPIASLAAFALPTSTKEFQPLVVRNDEKNVITQKANLITYNVGSTANNQQTFSHLPETENGFWAQKEHNHATATLQTKWSTQGNLSNTYSNLTYNLRKKELTPAQQKKRKKQLAYIERFAKVAKTEMEKYGIPASITLAQGLLESNVGESRLSTQNNNHFGIKCFSKSCKKGHCSNFTDDSHKDFFRKYTSAWESYRAHSKMLGRKRYVHLKKLNKTDYTGWAKGLKKAGYATDKKYAEKLINLIEALDLYQFDR